MPVTPTMTSKFRFYRCTLREHYQRADVKILAEINRLINYFFCMTPIKTKFLTALLLTLGTIIFSSSAGYGQAEDVVRDYLAAIKSGDWAKAKSFWLESEIERANKLGIKFIGINAKYDCTFPYINDRSRLALDKCLETISSESNDNKKAIIKVSAKCPAYKQIEQKYYLVKNDEDWKLCSSMHFYTGGWRNHQSKYFRVHYDDSSLLNDQAMVAMDSFVDSLIDILQVTGDRQQFLETNKIDYYLCTPDEMKLLTGYDAHGMTSFPFDAIITRHLPHTHEIVHLMTNYALQELPLYTVPVIQEGLACCLGGRWSKSSDIINYWGNVSLSLGLASLDDLITTDGFVNCNGGADAAYAIGSLFAQALIDNFGAEKFMEFYRSLSGDLPRVESLPADSIKGQAEKIFGVKWQIIENNFNKLVQDNKYCGIIPEHHKANGNPVANLKSEKAELRIYDNDSTYYFEIKIHDEGANAILAMMDSDSLPSRDYQSWQYAQHLPDTKYNGEHFGLRVNKDEAGLYDYFTNTLTAKYVYSFTPDENYYNAQTGQITFSLDKNVLPENIKNYNLTLH